MKKSTFILVAITMVILSSCARGHMPQRPAPMKKGRRHGGSVVMAPVQHPVVQNVG